VIDYSDAAREATRLVRDAGLDPDAPVGVAAFNEIFRRLLDGQDQPTSSPAVTAAPGPVGDPMHRLAEWLDLSPAAIEDIAAISETGADLHLHTRFLAPSKAARQRQLALIKLALDRVGFDRDAVPAREINELCARYGCLDQNLPTNLEKFENFVTRRGKRGAYSYRLTQYGIDNARDIIRSLVEPAA